MKISSSVARALLLILSLIGLTAAPGRASVRAEIVPSKIQRIIVGDSFEQLISITAVGGELKKVSFVSHSLKESGGKSWVIPANIAFKPASTNLIEENSSRDFLLSVQNIPGDGHYEGVVVIDFEDGPAPASVPISIWVVSFEPSQGSIVLRFQKAVWGHGGPETVESSFGLRSGPRAPADLLKQASKATLSLGDFVYHKDGSTTPDFARVIPPESFKFSPDDIAIDGSRLRVKARFKNPNAEPGIYKGKLFVHHEELEALAELPVIVQVRGAAWLAWVLIAVGVCSSLWIGWWTKKGKQRTLRRGEVRVLRGQLAEVEVTAAARKDLEAKLDGILRLIVGGKSTEFETAIQKAREALETARAEKKSLRALAERVSADIATLSALRSQLAAAFSSSTPVVGEYVDGAGGLEARFRDLKVQIEAEGSATVLDSSLSTLEDKLRRLGSRGLLDLLEEQRQQLSDLDALDASQTTSLGAHLDRIEGAIRNIRRDADLNDAETIVTEVDGILKAVALQLQHLGALRELIEKAKAAGTDVSEPEKLLGTIDTYLAEPRPFDATAFGNKLAALENAYEAATGDASPTAQELPSTFAAMQVASGREMAEPVEPTPETGGSDRFSDRIRKWWTPAFQVRAVNGILMLIVLPLLVVLGYGQLYADKPTFGDANIWQAYIGLFLWGFGITSTSASVSSVLKAFGQDPS